MDEFTVVIVVVVPSPQILQALGQVLFIYSSYLPEQKPLSAQ